MRILLLEDDKTLANLLSRYLQKYFIIDVVHDFDDSKLHISQFNYNITLLDRNIDEEDVGMNLIEHIRKKDLECGVIILSAYCAISDKIEGLNLGADDYLEKPFDNEELLARIHALSRRKQPLQTMLIDNLNCNIQNRQIKQGDEIINLSKKESDLFFYLLQKRNQIVSKEELLDALYLNPQNISSNTIDATIKNIRKKIPKDIIITIKTRGYIIE